MEVKKIPHISYRAKCSKCGNATIHILDEEPAVDMEEGDMIEFLCGSCRNVAFGEITSVGYSEN